MCCHLRFSWLILFGLIMKVTALCAAEGGERPAVPSSRIEVRSSSLVFALDAESLSAVSWQNRITGTSLPIGGGCELEVEVGYKPEEGRKVIFRPAGLPEVSTESDRAVLHLQSSDGTLAATLVYQIDPHFAVLRKFVELSNTGQGPLRVLNVVLGRYTVKAKGEGGERGFPLYLGDEYFVSLAHPAGFVRLENGQVVLRQYPGARLAPGGKFPCMEAVYGVARSGEARASFVSYARSRMRRVLRGHDKPYAVLEAFGGQPIGDNAQGEKYFWETETFLLEHLNEVAQSQREGGPQFDFYSVDFWHDTAGDLTTFHRTNFPGGFRKVRDEILRLGMHPGLWIDSGGLPQWTIGANPAIRGCFTKGEGQGEICRGCELINSMYTKAFIYHLRENKVRLLKFDNLGPDCKSPCCDNPAHGHLPGPLYSVEAIHSGIIDFLRALDAECPDVFVILYWGYRSPWWLQYADMYFESGAHIEAASNAESPAPYARDSVSQRLDQAQWLITDTPWLGKDSLGIWLSDWPWNSCIGKTHWQEGFIMDLCRGSLLAQIWTDTDWLTPPERRQLGDLVALLKANPDCFGNSRFILGNPWKSEPYGYCCSNGRRAFVAIHNACLKDGLVTLKLGSAWGLPKTDRWDVYRWYPEPAKLRENGRAAGGEVQIVLRPYSVVLLEAVPAGQPPSLGRTFEEMAIPTRFAEPTQALDLSATVVRESPTEAAHWQVLKPTAASARTAKLAILDDSSIRAGGENSDGELYTVLAPSEASAITGVMLEVLTDDALPGHGPGRAVNGNFALTDLRLMVAPKDKRDQRVEAKFHAAKADFSQTSHGGWFVTAAIDKSPATGWSIYPQTGKSHAAAFELDKPVGSAGETILILELAQGERGHSLGRFRLWVTTDKSPSLPAAYLPGQIVMHASLPASKSGGIVLLVGGKGVSPPNALLAGPEMKFESVWSDKAYWKCSWRAWRSQVGPDDKVREVRVALGNDESGQAPQFSAYFIPK